MSPGLALGLLASLAWGMVDVMGAVASRRIGSLRVLAGSQLVSLVVLAVIVLADRSRLGDDPAAGILAGLPLGIGAAAAYLCYFTALRIGPLSVVSPVVVAYGGTTVVLAVLLRGESLVAIQVVGAVLATVGVVLAGVVFDTGSLRGARLVGPGVLIAIVTMLLFAVVTVALAAPIVDHGWLPVVLGSRLASTMSAVLLLGVVSRARSASSTRFDVLMEPSDRLDRSTLGLVAVAGVFDMLAFAVYAVGLEVAPTWLVGLASSFGPVIAVAYGVWRLGERPRSTQWLGLALLGVGVVVLAVAG
jgi:drug/metabolite transporter (DMT)-like permease